FAKSSVARLAGGRLEPGWSGGGRILAVHFGGAIHQTAVCSQRHRTRRYPVETGREDHAHAGGSKALFRRWPKLVLAVDEKKIKWRQRPGLKAVDHLPVTIAH